MSKQKKMINLLLKKNIYFLYFSRPHQHSSDNDVNIVNQTPSAHSNVISSSTSLKIKPILKETTLKPVGTSPSKFSLKPMSTDGNTMLNSIHSISTQTRPASWYSSSSSTEPGFITSNNNNHHNLIIYSSSKPSTTLLNQMNAVTTEPGFITRTKTKPSTNNYKPKPKPTKKPVPSSTFKSTIKFVTKTTTTARSLSLSLTN